MDWVDAKEQLLAINMIEVGDRDRVTLRKPFRTMVQAALIDEQR